MSTAPPGPDLAELVAVAAVGGALVGFIARGRRGILLGGALAPAAVLALSAAGVMGTTVPASAPSGAPPRVTGWTSAPSATTDANGLPVPAEGLASYLEHGTL